MNYLETISQLSKELDLSDKVVENTYKAFWRAIRDMITTLPLKDMLNLEEFDKLRTSYNIPSLGKLACTFDRYNKVRKKAFYKL